MKILIFGASGMLGTELELMCKKRSIYYKALTHHDVEATNNEEVLNAIESYAPTVIVNCIAMVGINPCEENMIKSYQLNTLIPYELSKIAEEKNITLVHISSHAVFDGEKDDYYTEEDIAEPINIYGTTKLEADILVQKRCSKHYLIRVPTMFGHRRNSSIGFVDKMLQWMEEKESIQIADDKIDTPTYAKDVAEQILFLLKENYPYGLYHVANSQRVSYYDFVKEIQRIKDIECDLIPAKDSDFLALAPKPLKTSLISKKLDPLRSWKDALTEYLQGEQ